MEILLWLALAALPFAAVIAVAGAVVALVVGIRVPSAVLAALVPVLLIVWVVTTYRSGISADETGTSGDVFATVGWLVAAVAAGLNAAAISVGLRKSLRGRPVRNAG